MQVTRLLQNASNHQLFKDGPNLSLNDWINDHTADLDAFLELVVSSPSAVVPLVAFDRTAQHDALLQLVKLFCQV
jgi:hypothetical protein